MTFSKIVQAVMREYQLTPHDLHHRFALPEEMVQGWIEGTAVPERKTLEDFSAMFAIPIDVLEKSLPR